MAKGKAEEALETLKGVVEGGVSEEELEKVRSLLEEIDLEEEHSLISETLESAEELSLKRPTIKKLEVMKEDLEDKMD